jgi:hypothetical protein
MAPMPPLAPPPPRAIASAPDTAANAPVPEPPTRARRARTTLIAVAAGIVVAVVAAVLVFALSRRAAAPTPVTIATRASPTSGATPAGGEAVTDLLVQNLHLVPDASTSPFTDPGLNPVPAPVPSLLLVVRYQQRAGDGKVAITILRIDQASPAVDTVLNRTYLLSRTGADVVHLLPATGSTFGPGHYELTVAHAGQGIGALTFDILGGPATH